MKKGKAIVSMLLLLPILLALIINPVQASVSLSPHLETNRILGGTRQVGHDNNNSLTIRYYAAIYIDPQDNLNLAAYTWLTNELVLVQQAVANTSWASGDYAAGYRHSFCMSNVDNSSFYIAYVRSINSISLKKVTFIYTAASILTSFTIGNEITFITPNVIYDTGMDCLWTPENRIWVAVTLQTEVLNAVIFQLFNGLVVKTTVIPKDFLSFWNTLLGSIGNNVYAWVYSHSGTLQRASLYYADNGTLITLSSEDSTPGISSISSLGNGKLVVISYTSSNGLIESVLYTPPATVSITTVFNLGYVADLSTFSMPNYYYGFYFIDASNSLSATYYSDGLVAPWSGWSPIQRVYTKPLDVTYLMAGVSADPLTNIGQYPGRPTAWVMFAGVQLTNMLVSADLYSSYGLVVSTSYQVSMTSSYITYTSQTSKYTTTSTTITTTTQTASALQTPTFLSSLIVLLLFILMPSGLFGLLMGLMGFALGGMIGAGIAFVFGKLPLWLLLVIILIEAIILFMYRDSGKE